MAAILGSPVTTMPESLHSSLTGLMDADSVGMVVGLPLPATIQFLFFELYVFPVFHPPCLSPVEHGWNTAECNNVSSSSYFEVVENQRSNLVFIPIDEIRVFVRVLPKLLVSN
jgi:hypothetical protein